MAGLAARWPDALQHRLIRTFRRHVRLVRCNGRHHRHRRHPANSETGLQRTALPRHHRRGRHARHPDPAIDQPDPLRASNQHVGARALPRWFHPRLPARSTLYSHRCHHLHHAPRMGWRKAVIFVGRKTPRPAVASTTAGYLPGGRRIDLRRYRHTDRSGLIGRCRRDGSGGL